MCISTRAPSASTAQLWRKWTSPSNEGWQAVDVTLLVWRRSFAFNHLRVSQSWGWPRVVSLLVSAAAGWKQFAFEVPPLKSRCWCWMRLWYSNQQCCCDTAILFPTMPWLWCFVFFSDLQVRSATPATSQTETYQLGLGFWWGAKHVEHQKYVPHCQATSLFKKTDHKCVQDSCFLCI